VSLITVHDGKVIFRDGKVGTEQACCCGGVCDEYVAYCAKYEWSITYLVEGNNGWDQKTTTGFAVFYTTEGSTMVCLDGNAVNRGPNYPSDPQVPVSHSLWFDENGEYVGVNKEAEALNILFEPSRATVSVNIPPPSSGPCFHVPFGLAAFFGQVVLPPGSAPYFGTYDFEVWTDEDSDGVDDLKFIWGTMTTNFVNGDLDNCGC